MGNGHEAKRELVRKGNAYRERFGRKFPSKPASGESMAAVIIRIAKVTKVRNDMG